MSCLDLGIDIEFGGGFEFDLRIGLDLGIESRRAFPSIRTSTAVGAGSAFGTVVSPSTLA